MVGFLYSICQICLNCLFEFFIQVRHEMRKMLGLSRSDEILKEWPNWVKRIFAYSKLESKSRVCLKELLCECET